MDYFKSLGIDLRANKFHEQAAYGVALLYHFLDNRIAAHLAGFGLTPAKFNVLMVLKHQAGGRGMSQVAIGKRLIVTASNMTRLLDKLEKEGLTQRSAQKGDRRVKTIHITPKGSHLLDKAWPGYDRQLKDLAATLDTKDQKALSGLLIKWFSRLMKD